MRRYRTGDPTRLRDLLLEEMAGILDRHARGLAAADATAVAEVRREVAMLLEAAERAPGHFIGKCRHLRSRRNAAAEEAADA